MFGISKLFGAATDLAAALTGLAGTVRQIDTHLRSEARLDAPARPELVEGEPLLGTGHQRPANEPSTNGTGKGRRKAGVE